MNRYSSLIKTLDSLYRGKYLPKEIVIIDQSSQDNLNSNIQTFLKDRYEKCNIIYYYQQVASLTKARNKGITIASEEYIIFSDDDIEYRDDTIKNVYDIFESDKQVGMIGGIDEITEKNKLNKVSYIMGAIFCRKKINCNEGHITKAIFGAYPKKIVGRINSQWAMGYFFALRKSLVFRWSLTWDEKLKSYAYPEDLDFSYSFYKRAINENIKIVLDSNVKVQHLVSTEWRVNSFKSTLMFIVYREYLSYKHFKNFNSRIQTRWSNFGEFLRRLSARDKPFDIVRAQVLCDLHRGEIKKGIFPKELS
jgi:GT2 family glycosyltransferase